jgi:prohead serine protease
MQHRSDSPVGKGISAETDSSGATWVTSRIVDEKAQKFLRKGVLTAYSIGMRNPVVVKDPTGKAYGGIIKSADLCEISLVDSPSNVNTGITLIKSRKDGTAQFVGKSFGNLEKAVVPAYLADTETEYLRSLLLRSSDPAEIEYARQRLAA